MRRMQRALSLIYPDQCVLCRSLVDRPGSLCGACWSDTPFLMGLVCDLCGAAVQGEADGFAVHCDDCLVLPRPWAAGRAALSYRGAARRLVLALKHGDRMDLAVPAAQWMLTAGQQILGKAPVLVPVPIHWSRRLKRRYNQSAVLARAMSQMSGHTLAADALRRLRRTPPQDGMSVDARFANMADALDADPVKGKVLRGRDVCLIDDVMTSGATLAAAAEACHNAGATRVSVLVLARVEKTP